MQHSSPLVQRRCQDLICQASVTQPVVHELQYNFPHDLPYARGLMHHAIALHVVFTSTRPQRYVQYRAVHATLGSMGISHAT